jgi:hypothetical protein
MKGFHNKQKIEQYMTTKPPLQKILKGILHMEDENKHNHEWWEVLNPIERTDNCSESSTESAAHMQTLKRPKQLIHSNLHIPLNTITEFKGLNSPIKKHWMAYWIKKEDLTICCIQETHLNDILKHYLRVKGWKMIYQANGPWEQAGVAILISYKVDFKLKLLKR